MEQLINAYLMALSQCVAEEVNAISPTCFAGITVGDSYISMSGIGDCEGEDDAACGEAWVRVVSMYPSVTTGTPATGTTNCQTGLGINIEIGVLRCFTIAEGGEAPSAADLLASSQAAIADAAAVYRAMVCCTHFPTVLVGQWTPVGPTGGLVGGIWTLAVSLD